MLQHRMVVSSAAFLQERDVVWQKLLLHEMAELRGDARPFRGAEVSARPRRAPEEKRQNSLPFDAEACPSRSASTTLTRYHRRRYPENSLLDARERLQRADGQTRPNRGQRCVHPGEATGLVQRRKSCHAGAAA